MTLSLFLSSPSSSAFFMSALPAQDAGGSPPASQCGSKRGKRPGERGAMRGLKRVWRAAASLPRGELFRFVFPSAPGATAGRENQKDEKRSFFETRRFGRASRALAPALSLRRSHGILALCLAAVPRKGKLQLRPRSDFRIEKTNSLSPRFSAAVSTLSLSALFRPFFFFSPPLLHSLFSLSLSSL